MIQTLKSLDLDLNKYPNATLYYLLICILLLGKGRIPVPALYYWKNVDLSEIKLRIEMQKKNFRKRSIEDDQAKDNNNSEDEEERRLVLISFTSSLF